MTAAYRTIPNPTYTIYTLSKYGNQQPNTFSQLHYVHTYAPLYKFKVFSLHNIIYNSTCINVRRILICSSIRYACTWKIVFKIQNNELNELSECMLYKMFFFSRKNLKTVKLPFTEYFSEVLLTYFKVCKTLCTCLLLKFIKLLIFACLLLKVY